MLYVVSSMTVVVVVVIVVVLVPIVLKVLVVLVVVAVAVVVLVLVLLVNLCLITMQKIKIKMETTVQSHYKRSHYMRCLAAKADTFCQLQYMTNVHILMYWDLAASRGWFCFTYRCGIRHLCPP